MLRCHSATHITNDLGNYKPVNLIATYGISCLHCGLLVHPNDFSLHSRMHIPSNHRLRSSKNKTPRKIKMDTLLEEKQNAEDLAIRSFLPSELPQKQEVRKQTILKKTVKHAKFTDQMPEEFNKALFDSIPYQQETNLEDGSLQKEMQSNIQLIKKIKMSKQRLKVNKKYLTYFESDKKEVPLLDEFRSPAKTQRRPQTLEKNGYAVEKMKKQTRNQPITINILSVKKMGMKEKVGTISTKNSFFTHSRLKSNTEDRFTEVGESNQYGSNQLQCQQCKGFYCHSCGSDIPPQFRPTNASHLSPLVLGQARAFYRDHVYKNKTSRGQYSQCQTCGQ